MGAVTARVAGVEEIVVLLARRAPGRARRVRAVRRRRGLPRSAAPTASPRWPTAPRRSPRVDVIAGPGGLWVQEAKRLVSGDVGIDGFLGPSDVFIVASRRTPTPSSSSLDLLAQAEHGEGTIVGARQRPTPRCSTRSQARCGLDDRRGRARSSTSTTWTTALAVAEAFAPEHLAAHGRAPPSALAPRVRRAGCVFVGRRRTAFGDYVAGSNHSLPTGGSARFASGAVASATSAAAWPRSTSATPRSALAQGRRADRAGRGLRACTRDRWRPAQNGERR